MRNPIVILHGWSDNSRSFRDLAHFLQTEFGAAVQHLYLADWLSLQDEISYGDLAAAMQLEAPKTLFGEPCRPDEVEQVRSWITNNPGWSRYRLSRELCNRWQWVRPNGQLADMAGFRLPVEAVALQALVSEPIKPIIDSVIMSNAVHGYISQSDKGDLVIGAGIDGYNGYGQRGSYGTIEHTLQAIVEMFPVLSRVRMNRQWGGIVDTSPDACPIISKTPVPNLFFNCGWGTGGFKATPGSGHVFAASLAKGEMHPLAKPFSMDRFHTGALIDEHGAAAVAH